MNEIAPHLHRIQPPGPLYLTLRIPLLFASEPVSETNKGRASFTEWGLIVMPACELCGQPAARQNPALCAECYYRYWYWQKSTEPFTEHGTITDSPVI